MPLPFACMLSDAGTVMYFSWWDKKVTYLHFHYLQNDMDYRKTGTSLLGCAHHFLLFQIFHETQRQIV